MTKKLKKKQAKRVSFFLHGIKMSYYWFNREKILRKCKRQIS